MSRLFFFKKLYLSLIILAIVLVSTFLLESLLRIYGLGDPLIYKTNLSYRYAPLPNQSVTRFKKSKITINEMGLRSTQEWDKKNLNKILFFGDSVTYGGSYLDNKEIFSELVCENLNQKSKKKYLCGNAGVNAYGVDNIKNRILYGEIQDSKWIVITLLEEDGFRSLQNISAIPVFLEKPAFLPAIQEIFLYTVWKANIYLRNSPKYYVNKKEDGHLFEESFINLKKVLINEIKKNKKILVIFHPLKRDILDEKESENFLIMKKVFQDRESEIILVNMFPVLKSKYSDDIYYDNGHLNKAGHIIFSNKISSIIRKHDRSY
jgi:lysophospholipase L1-like esterase